MDVLFDRRAKHLRILLAVRRQGSLRFTDVLRRTGLSPTEVQRHLGELSRDHFVHARPYARRGDKILLEYTLSKKGEAHLAALDAYRDELERQGKRAGASSLRALRDIYV